MYGYQYTQSGSAMKPLCIFVGLLLVSAVVAGIILGGTELLNPSVRKAEADKLKAETDALRAQAAYEHQQREIELKLAEQKATVELQAFQERRAKELELLELAVTVGLIVGSAAVTALAFAGSYYLIERARALPREQPVREMQRPDLRILPSRSERKRGISDHTSTPPKAA